MTEAIRVAELMDRFREGSPSEECIVPWQAIGLLAKPPQRDERPHSDLICQPEDKVEPLNRQIDADDAKRPVCRSGDGDAMEDGIRVVLTPTGNEALRWHSE